jgi:hypothetical protein
LCAPLPPPHTHPLNPQSPLTRERSEIISRKCTRNVEELLFANNIPFSDPPMCRSQHWRMQGACEVCCEQHHSDDLETPHCCSGNIICRHCLTQLRQWKCPFCYNPLQVSDEFRRPLPQQEDVLSPPTPGVELEVKDAKLAEATVRVAQGAAGSQTLLHQIRNENRSLAELWPLLLETTPDSELGRTVTAKTATGAVNPSHRFALLAVARNLLEAPGIFISSAVTLYIDARRQFLFNLQRSSEAWEAWDVEPVLPALYEDRCRDNQKKFRKGLAADLLSSYNLLWFLAQKTNVQWTALEGLLFPNVPGMPKFIQETIARIRGVTRNTLSPADYGLIREQFPPELRAVADWLVVKTGGNATAQDLGIKGSLLDLDRRFTVLLPRLQSQKQTVRLVVESGVAKDKDKATREMTRRHATAVGFFSNVHRIAAAIQHRKESSVPGMIDAIQQAAEIAGAVQR